MERDEVKKRLVLYRPGGLEENGPEMLAALEEVRRDPELSEWFRQQRAFQGTMEAALKNIEPPRGLREQILSRSQPRKNILRLPGRVALAIAAALVILIGVIFSLANGGQDQFKSYRERMVRTALRDYRMTMVSSNQNEIRAYIQKASPHGNYVLTPPLKRLAGEGCVLLSWQGHPVSLICLDAGNRRELFLFVINREDVGHPPERTPEFRQENKLATLSWSEDDKVYLLAGKVDRALLEKYL